MLFNILRGQLRENGAPDMVAINNVLSIYEIEDRRTAFDKLIMCFNIVISIEREKDKEVDD